MKEETVITLYSPVFCNAEYSEKPGCAVIKLTQKNIDRIKHLTKIVVDEGVHSITLSFDCDWYDVRPAFKFDELGKKFRILYDDYDFDEMGEETDPDAEFQYEHIGSCEMVIYAYGFKMIGIAKHSDAEFESRISTVDAIEVALSDPADTPREKYYFSDPAQAPALEDLPKMLNGSDLRLSTYAKEKLKQGA